MQQYGTASIYGVEGSVTVGAAYVMPESLESEQTAQIEEFKNGLNQLLGFCKSDERIVVDLVMVPKAATLANANTAPKFPVGPCKVTLDGFPDDGAAGPPNRQIDGDYIYLQGARRSLQKGQASFRMQIFRPVDLPSGMTIDLLVAAINA
jgi:hypothetical protein